MKTIIEIHALQNYAPSNLNRDDTGAPKDALFGGTRRARVSSQCLKRSIRQYFTGLVEQNLLATADVAYRTKRVLDALIKSLTEKGRNETEAEAKSRLALGAMELTVKEDGKSEYLLFLGQREISGIPRKRGDEPFVYLSAVSCSLFRPDYLICTFNHRFRCW